MKDQIERLGKYVADSLMRAERPFFVIFDRPFMTVTRWGGYILVLIGLFTVNPEYVVAGSLTLLAHGVNAIALMFQHFIGLSENKHEKP